MITLSDLKFLLPECLMFLSAMALLMWGVFSKNTERIIPLLMRITLLILALALLIVAFDRTSVTLLNGLFTIDNFTTYMKGLVLLGGLATCSMTLGICKKESYFKPEFPVLILFAILGMFLMISCNDLISLYLGVEIQSLSLYILAGFKRNSPKSTEAALKYFILGALASGILLYGLSLVYGLSGGTNFKDIAIALSPNWIANPSQYWGLVAGFVLVIGGIVFKISAVPFHMWAPDVYEGVPMPITAFFAVVPKIAAFALLVRLLIGPFAPLVVSWQAIILALSVLSMVWGAFAAIAQSNMKRLMAYSSISHMGFSLLGLASGRFEGFQSVLIYLSLYVFMTAGIFACLLCLRYPLGEEKQNFVDVIEDLKGLSKTSPKIAFCLAAFLFSMAGVPPLAGFFAKFYVFIAAIEAGFVIWAIVGVLASVVGAFYYIRIVKYMYFDEPESVIEVSTPYSLAIPMTVSAVVIMSFILYPNLLVQSTSLALAAITNL
ncbi:MAG: NADH-quinone oxidoreductase subunit NuoN [Alphaproteobacteria bacterium]|nr:NADH-quinone oxidoreductase subunit NuoN [Alphaproteobacteria bacterium]MBT5390508.1 NADH-quinone oxidoreductase subunit NuoN [Alphaproteobacteria bacterium]